MQELMIGHLHTHKGSNLKIKDSTIRIEKLIPLAQKLNITSIAITEHEAITSHIDFLQQIQKHNENSGHKIKPILGNEIYVVPENTAYMSKDGHYDGRVYGHLILLANNKRGHETIRKLSSIAWENGFLRGKYYTTPVDYKTLKENINKGDITCTTACLGSLYSRLTLNYLEAKKENQQQLMKNILNKIVKYIKDYQDIFGKDYFYLELQPNKKGSEQWNYNKFTVALSKKLNVPFTITTDAHYLRPENKEAHSIFLRSQENDNREIEDFYEFTYVMSADEIHNLMDENIGKENVDIGIASGLNIAEKIGIYDLSHEIVMPPFDIKKFIFDDFFVKYLNRHSGIKYFYESDNQANRQLLYEIQQGLFKKIKQGRIDKSEIDRYVEEININLDVLQDYQINHNKNYSYYFLGVRDLVIELKEKANVIVGVGRGSAGAFIINYFLDIVDVDAIKFKLPYWRFLAKGRLDTPDIDLDFPPHLKHKIMEVIYDKYGKDRVVTIGTIGTEGSKSALLSSGRGLKINHELIHKMTDIIPNERGKDWSLSDCIYGNEKEDRKAIPRMVKYKDRYPKLFEIALELEGLVNKRSSHASGVIIYPEEIYKYNSIMYTNGGTKTTGWTMADSEYAGGIKVDILFTEFQSKLQVSLELLQQYNKISKYHNINDAYEHVISPPKLPYKEKNIWKNMHEGKTGSVFQFEQVAGKRIAMQTKPNNIYEMSAANSLMRLKSDLSVDHIYNKFQEDYKCEIKDEQIYLLKKIFEDKTLTDKFIEYKNNIGIVLGHMKQLGIRKEVSDIIIKTLEDTYGVCVTQEDLMSLCMNLADFSISESHSIRKAVAKKKAKLLNESEKLLVEKMLEKDYLWIEIFYTWLLIMGLAGYGFSTIHSVEYSIIGYQGMTLNYNYPLYWNTARLLVDAKSIEDNQGTKQNPDYAKISSDLSQILNEEITIKKPDVNKSAYGFEPNEKENAILYGLKSISGISEDVANQILEHRPYNSFKDFLQRCIIDNPDNKINKTKMLYLMFGGCFDTMEENLTERIKIYLNFLTNKIQSVTMTQLLEADDLGLIPKKYKNIVEIFKDRKIIKDSEYNVSIKKFSIDKLNQIYSTYNEAIIKMDNVRIEFDEKQFEKIYKKHIKELQDWMKENKDELVEKANEARMNNEFKEWTKGKHPQDIQFVALGVYYNQNYLPNLAKKSNHYLIDDLTPKQVDKYFTTEDGDEVPIYKTHNVLFTFVDKDPKHKVIKGFSGSNVVSVKMTEGQYNTYSELFKRGNILSLIGYKMDDENFRIKMRKSEIKHYQTGHPIRLIR